MNTHEKFGHADQSLVQPPASARPSVRPPNGGFAFRPRYAAPMLFTLLFACTPSPTDSATGAESGDETGFTPDSSDSGDTAETDSGDSADTGTDERITVAGFASPESVLYDAEGDVYLVSNINGGPADLDDNGFISKLAPDGTILDLHFIDGADPDVELNGPKGSYIVGDWLWVADIDVVRVFDRETGAPLHTFPVEGATFLNDVTFSGEDGVFVSDSAVSDGGTSLWAINSGGDTFFQANGTELPKPNGLLFEYPSIFALSDGGLVTVELNGTIASREELPAGKLDGIVVDTSGRYLVSSWDTESIYRSGDAGWEVVASGLPSPADIGYDSTRNRVLVPLFLQNEVAILPL